MKTAERLWVILSSRLSLEESGQFEQKNKKHRTVQVKHSQCSQDPATCGIKRNT